MPQVDFNAMKLAAAKLNPQMSHMGIIEFYLDSLIPQGQDSLQLGVQDFNLPNPRRVNPVPIRYINGVIKRPGQPEPIGEVTVNFVDYVNGGQRQTLHDWFDLTHNELTGTGRVPSEMLSDARAIMFNAAGVPTTMYYLFNVWLTNDPAPAPVNYQGGNIVVMQATLSVDFCLEEMINGIPKPIGSYSSIVARSIASAKALSGQPVNTNLNSPGIS